MLSPSELASAIRERIESACEEEMGKHGLMRKNTDFKVIPFSPHNSTEVTMELTEGGSELPRYRVHGIAHVAVLTDVITVELARALNGIILEVSYEFTIDPILETVKNRMWDLQNELDTQNGNGQLF